MASYYVRSGAGGSANGTSWANAYLTLNAAFSGKLAGDIFYVSEDHAETQASVMTLSPPSSNPASPNFVYCVNHSGSVPPVSADLRTTATIKTTGANLLQINSGYCYFYGITFSAGSGAVSSTISLSVNNSGWLRLDSCALVKAGTSGIASAITIGPGNTAAANRVDLYNTTMEFGATGDSAKLTCAFNWRNTASAIAGATLPTTLFTAASCGPSPVLIEGVDLSAIASGSTLFAASYGPQVRILKDCKLASGVTVAATPVESGQAETFVIRSDSAGTNYRHEKYQYMGTQTVETVAIRTSGASDGATGLSWKIATTANSKWVLPFEALPIAIWNATTASNVTATIEGLWNAAALPNNDDMWFDLEYLGASGNPQGSFVSASKADNLAAGVALTASTKAWDGQATARANSHAYSVGGIISVASNAGRIFFCTTAGTSAGSEPGGYATAVDGGSVTDSGAVFRAATRFSIAVTASSPQPAQAGTMYAYVKAAKASSTFYLDPLITLS